MTDLFRFFYLFVFYSLFPFISIVYVKKCLDRNKYLIYTLSYAASLLLITYAIFSINTLLIKSGIYMEIGHGALPLVFEFYSWVLIFIVLCI